MAKPGLQQKLTQECRDTVPAARAVLPLTGQAKEDIWALEGVERMAGKGWEALEAERKLVEMENIKTRVQAAINTTSVSLRIIHATTR